MSRIVRRNELHRQRARRHKLRKLRERYARARTTAEKEQILQKLSRVAPCASAEQFLAAVKAK